MVPILKKLLSPTDTLAESGALHNQSWRARQDGRLTNGFPALALQRHSTECKVKHTLMRMLEAMQGICDLQCSSNRSCCQIMMQPEMLSHFALGTVCRQNLTAANRRLMLTLPVLPVRPLPPLPPLAFAVCDVNAAGRRRQMKQRPSF